MNNIEIVIYETSDRSVFQPGCHIQMYIIDKLHRVFSLLVNNVQYHGELDPGSVVEDSVHNRTIVTKKVKFEGVLKQPEQFSGRRIALKFRAVAEVPYMVEKPVAVPEDFMDRLAAAQKAAVEAEHPKVLSLYFVTWDNELDYADRERGADLVLAFNPLQAEQLAKQDKRSYFVYEVKLVAAGVHWNGMPKEPQVLTGS